MGLLLSFVILKNYAFLRVVVGPAGLVSSVQIVGLSYMLFRQIHVVVDSMQQQIPALTFVGYFNYQMNLFALLSGPIQRYPDFDATWSSVSPANLSRHQVLMAYMRVFAGVIKIAALGALAQWVAQDATSYIDAVHAGNEAYDRWAIIGNFLLLYYLFPMYVYLNFAGHCDIVIAGGRLVGLNLPENFRQPYIARNMIDFWNRWHRTLSFFIRDYLFTPMYKALVSRWPRHASVVPAVCYFLALWLAGVWHGSTWNFAVFGLLHGLGVFAAKTWEQRLVSARGRKGLKRYLESRTIRVAAILVNVHFVCLTFLAFHPGVLRYWAIVKTFLGALIPGHIAPR
jgi:D-alanyl-lipoteichoic acid acyltransferase DltB (MBOAT superfamily)